MHLQPIFELKCSNSYRLPGFEVCGTSVTLLRLLALSRKVYAQADSPHLSQPVMKQWRWAYGYSCCDCEW